MPFHTLRAAAVQFQSAPADKAANMRTVARFVEEASAQGVELIVFPEMCLTGYWFVRNLSREGVAALAESVPMGPMTTELVVLAQRHNMVIGAGLIESDGGALYNSYVVAMPTGEAHCHRKLHAFISPHIECGDEYTVFDLPGGARAAVLICYDNNIIENARACALAGAEVLLAPHQTGGCRSRSPRAMGAIDPALWNARHESPAAIEAEFRGPKGRGWLMRWLPSRAHDNGMFLIFSNGVGIDDDEVRTGNAMILDCYGEVLSESCKAADDMVIADLNGAELDTCTGRRWLQVRRPELYGRLVEAPGEVQSTRRVRMGEE